MRIIGISTVRNEADIVEQALTYAARQMNLILVVDCGSEDKTIEVIERVCRNNSNVMMIGTLHNHHARQVRRHIWERFRQHLSINDWWAVVDADEFAENKIRQKVEKAHNELADHIWSCHVNFYYTESEARSWYEGKESLIDRERPIETRRKFYRMHTSQTRLFRNLPWLRWNKDTSWPENLAKPAKDRIIYRHYQYRDVQQIALRLKTRGSINATEDLTADNPHWFYKDISQAISSDQDASLRKYVPGHDFQIDESLPPATNQKWPKSIAKYTLAIAKSINPQVKSELFLDINPKDIVAYIKTI